MFNYSLLYEVALTKGLGDVHRPKQKFNKLNIIPIVAIGYYCIN